MDNSNSLKVMGERIAAGKPIGDGYLFGRLAHDLIRSGHATELGLRKYRSTLYFSERDTFGELEAKRREKARMDNHRGAATMEKYGEDAGDREARLNSKRGAA